MTTAGAAGTATGTNAVAIPSSETLPWLISSLLVGLVLYYVIGVDQGATSAFGDHVMIHEFVHDARHLLGFPCH